VKNREKEEVDPQKIGVRGVAENGDGIRKLQEISIISNKSLIPSKSIQAKEKGRVIVGLGRIP